MIDKHVIVDANKLKLRMGCSLKEWFNYLQWKLEQSLDLTLLVKR